jgi:hypothetical protein
MLGRILLEGVMYREMDGLLSSLSDSARLLFLFAEGDKDARFCNVDIRSSSLPLSRVDRGDLFKERGRSSCTHVSFGALL